MSGTWKPNPYEGQTLVNQIEKTKREIAVMPEQRYQPIAPYGGIPNMNRPENKRVGRACIKKRGPPKGYIGTLENRLQRIEGLIDGMSTDNNSPPTSSNKNNPNDDTSIYEQDHVSRKKQKLRVENKKVAPDFPNDSKVILEAIKSHSLPSEGRFISGYNTSHLFTRINMQHKELLVSSGIDIQCSKDGEYIRVKKLSSADDKRQEQLRELIELGVMRSTETIQSISDWIWNVAGIKKELSDRLVRIYFRYIHSLLPVINKTEFLEEYRGIRPCYPSGAILNAIFGASVRYIDNCKKFGDSDRLDDGRTWDFPEKLSEMLFQNLIIFIKGKYVPSLATIQAIVIAHNHSANVESWSSGWLLNCVAVRMSQDIGLHRSSETWNISQEEKETRRTVWWSVYILDRWLSSGTGRPLTIFDEDCDELYPSENVSLDEIMDVMTEKSQHLPRFPSLDKKAAANVTDSFIPLNQPFLHLLKLSEILGQILQGLYTPQAKKHSAKHGSDAVVAYLDNALSKWRASLPPLLEISSAGKRSLLAQDHVPILSMSGLLCLSYCTSLILLHRPFIEKQESDDTDGKKSKLSSQGALTICTNAAIRIVEVSESMHYRDFLMVSWGFALYPVFTASLIHIYNSSNPDSIVSDVAKSNLMRSLMVVDKLCLLSPMASKMGVILKKVISLSPVFVDNPEFLQALEVDKTLLHNHNTNLTTLSELTRDSTAYKKVGGNDEPSVWKSVEEADLLKNHWFLNNGPSHKPRLDNLTSSSDDGSWIDQLYIPSQSDVSYKDNNVSSNLPFIPTNEINKQPINPNANNPDIFSIRQFGLNMMNGDFPSQRTSQSFVSEQQSFQNHNSASLPMHRQSFSQNNNDLQQPVPSQSPFALFDLSEPSFPYFYGAPVINKTNTILSTSTSCQLNQQNISINMNTSTEDPSAIFRNRPDNPFWNMPSSMEVDDWHAYLLPHLEKQQHKPI
ncbi:hypothetical protein INT48_007322 [Thamnidium elegans]|uniref:Xylanolytic transcriptional activator regulatory domain-containing protein n=1 Tax=Thamnidium elegans TaxID=101142 RepID=A0A8H7SPN3_9FUNG|nr:hypothetical protein INT48_007322 [Thamnidium elegans]